MLRKGRSVNVTLPVADETLSAKLDTKVAEIKAQRQLTDEELAVIHDWALVQASRATARGRAFAGFRAKELG